MSTLDEQFKKFFERIKPDLKPYMRFSLTGTVVKTYADEYVVDIEFEEDVSLPKVPVNSIWAEDDYGVWAMPEEGSEVEVAFVEGDVTRPYVLNSRYQNIDGKQINRGYTVGVFAIVDKLGQRIEFKPDSGELSIKGDNIKIIAGGNKGEKIERDNLVNVGGKEKKVIGKNKSLVVKGNANETFELDVTRLVKGLVTEEINGLKQKIVGELQQSIGGGLIQTVGNNVELTHLGARMDSIAKQWQAMIGGHFDFMITNSTGNLNAVSIGALLGDFSLNTKVGNFNLQTLAGMFNILSTLGFNIVDSTGFSVTSSSMKLGGLLAVHPAAKGDIVKVFLASLLDIFATFGTVWCLDPVSGLIPLNPAVVTAFETLAATLDIPLTDPQSLTVSISP